MQQYSMAISRNTVDKLGAKLYDGVADVLAEIVSNSYDADAERVTVSVPAGMPLATRREDGTAADRGLEITVEDDGHGMTPGEANAFYLKIGADRREDARRGRSAAVSPRHGRRVMGRKGIGKLAPFGICRRIEVRSAGGDGADGGYAVSHFAMCSDDMVGDADTAYHPAAGDEDGRTSPAPGTRITLSDFFSRRVPDMGTLRRQLARRFSLSLPNFHVTIADTETGRSEELSETDMELEAGTKIEKDEAIDPGGLALPVRGWVAYSKHPYKNEDVAGVGIYARGRLAAVTRDFGRGAGFAGEHSMRSYLVGEIHADWIDGREDLIASGRRDILWSSDECERLKEWGQALVGELGRRADGPVREAAYRLFAARSGFEDAARGRFADARVCGSAVGLGRALGQIADRGVLEMDGCAGRLRDLVLAVAPGNMAAEKLAAVADEKGPAALEAVSSLLADARIAELASMGQTAPVRVGAIEKIGRAMRDAPGPREDELRGMLEGAPWLIDPRWTVPQAGKTLDSFRSAFGSWYADRHGGAAAPAGAGGAGKRPGVIFMSALGAIEVVEIKKPGHSLDADEYEGMRACMEELDEFIGENRNVAPGVTKCHMTLICDEVCLAGQAGDSFRYRVGRGQLDHRTWEELLSGAKAAHEDFVRLRDGSADAGCRE